jgi:hypothetical protein
LRRRTMLYFFSVTWLDVDHPLSGVLIVSFGFALC